MEVAQLAFVRYLHALKIDFLYSLPSSQIEIMHPEKIYISKRNDKAVFLPKIIEVFKQTRKKGKCNILKKQ